MPPSRLYLDHAATSFPKPREVHDAMADYMTRLGASPGRGAYAEARASGEIMQTCRERLNTLIHGENPDHVLFTLNTSDALNLALKGVLFGEAAKHQKRHVVTTWLDHNSVLRPLNLLAELDGIEQTRVECDPQTGLVNPEDLRQAIRRDTALVAVVHGSNVTGTVQPIAEIGALCREMAVPLLVDAAQTCGHLPIDVQAMQIDLLAAPGHKGLQGPLGTGFLYIRPGLELRMRTLREGGTGSRSDLDVQPTMMPDRFEPGSHNMPGIAGLNAAVKWVLDRGVEQLWSHEQALIRTMLEGLTGGMAEPVSSDPMMPGLTLMGPPGVKDRCGVFSIRIEGYDDPVALADRLEQDFGILTRAGIHCAPLAHRTVGTHALGGTTRLSVGPFTTLQDVKYATDAIAQLCHEHAAVG